MLILALIQIYNFTFICKLGNNYMYYYIFAHCFQSIFILFIQLQSIHAVVKSCPGHLIIWSQSNYQDLAARFQKLIHKSTFNATHSGATTLSST